jgi:excisionase family DNA binding protein
MLMHEWRQYRERQIRKVVKEAREAEDLAPEQAAQLEQAEATTEATAEAPTPELKSQPGQPRKQLLERLATNQVVVEKIQNYGARQQMLPLDVEAAPPPARTGKAAENREQLVQRLLDPVLSLEEAAILLNVCPTTVRRYTNRGVLKCDRTPGNQRRFRLSEIMSFMERRQMGEE